MGFKPSKRETLLPPPSDLNPNHTLVSGEESAAPAAVEVESEKEDQSLRDAAALTREEVIRRRSRRLRKLAACYRRQYWALMEEVRVKHRDYYWENGKSPFEEEEGEGEAEGDGGRVAEGNGVGLGLGLALGERKRCSFSGCKWKAMPLTRYCHPHILSDPKQTLYKACNFVIKSNAQTGQIICGRPVLTAASPSLCHVHFQRYQRNISQALRKAGLNMPSSSKSIPRLSVFITECVRQIQAKRRERLNASMDEIAHKDKKIG
ncbi:uncharacterized protein [Typha latifolia]|uniref:uncharacterized protein n=1 Tax=Typha latifolia TaxID=4733 RepID=UPI003C2BF381